NLSIELGAKMGMVAPDEATFDYLAGRAFAPRGPAWEAALRHWQTLPSDEGAPYDHEVRIDASAVAPQITWGTSPAHVVAIDESTPDPSAAQNTVTGDAWRAALEYQGLAPGQPLQGVPIDWAFIGSCTNGRLSDLEAAAEIVRGRRVAAGVRAWVVPGSATVKRLAEAARLDVVFKEAGFEWRESGCSMCSATNGETVGRGERCVSTSNRNFVGRQGPGARTHLASPAMAAAAAVTGRITDVRDLAAKAETV
ncbi:MAG TPA: aconitase family protein, partial [Dehalococcoidia bacterium]|nr:aconitase family protein [Dehalococcoidia bacterium]